MFDDDYDEHYLDAVRYLFGSLNDDIEDDSEEEYPRMVGMSEWLKQEADRATNNTFPYVGVDWGRMEPKSCDHKWAKYQGFTENYTFCEKCDVKK